MGSEVKARISGYDAVKILFVFDKMANRVTRERKMMRRQSERSDHRTALELLAMYAISEEGYDKVWAWCRDQTIGEHQRVRIYKIMSEAKKRLEFGEVLPEWWSARSDVPALIDELV